MLESKCSYNVFIITDTNNISYFVIPNDKEGEKVKFINKKNINNLSAIEMGNNSKNEASNEIGKERFLSALGKSSLLNPNLYSLNSLKLISLINPVPFEVDSIVASCLTTIISSFVI